MTREGGLNITSIPKTEDCGVSQLQILRDLLKSNIRRECVEVYGVTDESRFERVTDAWFDDDNNYDGRWQGIQNAFPKPGRILDMAAGCGTFLLYGLKNGWDVWGVEPEDWKLDYFRKKVELGGYPAEFADRMVRGVGESLPFADGTFDVATTYQTLEHVDDVAQCIKELLRVLKPGGALWILAPDYNCFWEPHYLVPFLPEMNRRLAKAYLRLLGRPLAGLNQLKWVTSRKLQDCCNDSGWRVRITDRSGARPFVMRDIIRPRLIWRKLRSVGRQENVIDLWVEKL